jgi:methionyl-tRNA formyltransferase
LRIVIASYGSAQFRFLQETLTAAGHVPVAYLTSRSMRPWAVAESDLLEATKAIVTDVPPGMDLLLPGSADTVADMLTGYRPDLLLVFGFNWRLPGEVLELPRLGVLNVHPSALPRYRGPSPVLWAIRNGDPFMGVTVHRMTARIDAGPILAQVDDIPVPDQVTSQDVWELTKAVLPGLLEKALSRAARGDPGASQDEREATYAGFPPPEWHRVTWQDTRQSLHNQIRVLRYLKRGQGPVVQFLGKTVQVHRTNLTDDGGIRIDCADGPLWVTYAPHDLGQARLQGSLQLFSLGVGERLEQSKRRGGLLAAGVFPAERMLAVGEVGRGDGRLPACRHPPNL